MRQVVGILLIMAGIAVVAFGVNEFTIGTARLRQAEQYQDAGSRLGQTIAGSAGGAIGRVIARSAIDYETQVQQGKDQQNIGGASVIGGVVLVLFGLVIAISQSNSTIILQQPMQQPIQQPVKQSVPMKRSKRPQYDDDKIEFSQ